MEVVKCNHCQKEPIRCGPKNLKVLPHMKIIACQIGEKMLQTINYEKVTEEDNEFLVKVD